MVRQRMTRADRRRQLLDLAWTVVREDGADALTLGRLAEVAGITKPVVYDHFSTRAGLVVAMFEEYDAEQSAALDAAVAEVGDGGVVDTARAIAVSYVDCVVRHGRELAGVAAALEGSTELADYKRQADQAYADQCRRILAQHTRTGDVPAPAMVGMLGAADAVSAAAAEGTLTVEEAYVEVSAVVVSVVERS